MLLTFDRYELTRMRPGDRITALDGRALDVAVAGPRLDGAVRLVNSLGTDTEWVLYPDQVGDAVTVHRTGPQYDQPIGPALPAIPDRTLRAIRRNGWYVQLRDLAALTDEDPRGVHVDRFEGMTFGQMGAHGYGLTERGAGRRWRISLTGRLALAAYRHHATQGIR